MPSSLRKPTQRLYRSFLYLDGDAVINSLSGLEGGDIDEVLTRSEQEGGGEIGGELAAGPVRGKAGKKRSKRYEEEVRKKRTEHSAATLLLKKLHEADAIGVIAGEYGPEEHADLEDHMVIEFQGNVVIHPLHQMISAARAWLKAAPGFGSTKAEVAEMKDTVQVLEALSQSGGDQDQTFLVFAETQSTDDSYKLVLPVKERNLLVPLDEFAGRATFVAQVDRVLEPDDQLMAMRLLRNAPQLEAERDGLIEALPDFLSGMHEVGIKATERDFILSAPAVLLKPICIYR